MEIDERAIWVFYCSMEECHNKKRGLVERVEEDQGQTRKERSRSKSEPALFLPNKARTEQMEMDFAVEQRGRAGLGRARSTK